ncbi:conserved Plasmodium protein, unknown function [Plasmodium reichenowi]|uniref:Uncharacterized protein n=1 Tax=Plasmodium reichenowi TaxID=5854 RepID=A0A2P9DH45_PLARE|nr:conserved Plasmodium protein, unknown function [Plasmodium reichenowi]
MTMENHNNANQVIDKNKVECDNKYIYTKFPMFDMHKKIKYYNKKISDINLENIKLKRCKKHLETHILEENIIFEKNFENYEKIISNALRLGYSCMNLCTILNKFINKDKLYVLRLLLRKRDEFKNNIIKSYIHKHMENKIYFKTLTNIIQNFSIKNKNFVTIFLVHHIKNKIKLHFIHFYNVILYQYNNVKEKCKHISMLQSNNHFNSNKLYIQNIHILNKILALFKLSYIIRNRFRLNVQNFFVYMLEKKKKNSFMKEKNDNIINMKCPTNNIEDDTINTTTNYNMDKENLTNYEYCTNKKKKFIENTFFINDNSSSTSSCILHPNDFYNYLYNEELKNYIIYNRTKYNQININDKSIYQKLKQKEKDKKNIYHKENNILQIQSYLDQKMIKKNIYIHSLKKELEDLFFEIQNDVKIHHNQKEQIKNVQTSCHEQIEKIQTTLKNIRNKHFFFIIGMGPPENLQLKASDNCDLNSHKHFKFLNNMSNTSGSITNKGSKILFSIKR